VIPDATTFGVFVAAALALLLVPGPAVLYIVARSIDQGRAAGLVSVLGVHLGSLVHVTAAAVGLSSLLVSSAVAFNVVKYAGAAYLIYLGVRALMTREEPRAVEVAPASKGRLLRQGPSSTSSTRRPRCSSWRSCRSSSTPTRATSGRSSSSSASSSWRSGS
jgi:threonine/homoserine/homoserine lactone efflux protein